MDTQKNILMEAHHGTFGYHDDKPILVDIDFILEAGEILTILGPNGAGKSTLLDCLAGLMPKKLDWIKLFGKDLSAYGIRERAQIIGYVSQMQNTMLNYNVRDYLVMGRSARLELFARPKKEDFARVDQALETIEIQHLAETSLQHMSGGERQQVQIARILVQEPRIVLFDEPTNHLDFGNQLKILGIIKQLSEQHDIAIIMTTHIPDHAIMLGGSCGILDHTGRLTVGPTETTVNEEWLREIYQADLHLVYVDEVGRQACLAGSLTGGQPPQDHTHATQGIPIM